MLEGDVAVEASCRQCGLSSGNQVGAALLADLGVSPSVID
jgi:hypothetical protein